MHLAESSMREYTFSVYIVANAARNLYTGMTNNLEKRVFQHKNKELEGYTSHWNICRLVHSESFDDVRTAIDREKEIKGWRRAKKIKLIESKNRNWHDLSEGWRGEPSSAKSLVPRRTTRSSG